MEFSVHVAPRDRERARVKSVELVKQEMRVMTAKVRVHYDFSQY